MLCLFVKRVGAEGVKISLKIHMLLAVNSARQATTSKSLVDVFPWKNPWELEDTWSLFPVTFANFFLLCLELSFAALPWKKKQALDPSDWRFQGWWFLGEGQMRRLSHNPEEAASSSCQSLNLDWMEPLKIFNEWFVMLLKTSTFLDGIHTKKWHKQPCHPIHELLVHVWKKLFEPFQLHQNQRFMQKEFFWNRGWWDFCAIV